MQTILTHLVFAEQQEVPFYADVSPWLDARWRPLEKAIEMLEAQQHQRIIKTHLPLDGLPYYPEVKYIVVGRDPRDVFMSFWNHYANYTDEFYAKLASTPGLVGDSLPRCPDDLHEAWHGWITRGWFEWESEGYPFWGNMHHTQSWWDFRHLNNILFVHFNDLLADLSGEIGRIAFYLDLDIPNDSINRITEAVAFANVKKRAVRMTRESSTFWKGGMKTFFFKGTNGRWKDVLTADELILYKAAVARVLSPGCASWLENGRRSLKVRPASDGQ